MRRTIGVVALAVGLSASLAGCSSTGKPKGTPNEGIPSPALQGNYAMTLKKSDLPPKPPQQVKPGKWNLLIKAEGGPNNSPTLAISRKKNTLESVRLGVDHDTLLFHGEVCGSTRGQVESIYRWHLIKGKLTILPFKNGCQDKVAESILTAHPWVKQKK